MPSAAHSSRTPRSPPLDEAQKIEKLKRRLGRMKKERLWPMVESLDIDVNARKQDYIDALVERYVATGRVPVTENIHETPLETAEPPKITTTPPKSPSKRKAKASKRSQVGSDYASTAGLVIVCICWLISLSYIQDSHRATSNGTQDRPASFPAMAFLQFVAASIAFYRLFNFTWRDMRWVMLALSVMDFLIVGFHAMKTMTQDLPISIENVDLPSPLSILRYSPLVPLIYFAYIHRREFKVECPSRNTIILWVAVIGLVYSDIHIGDVTSPLLNAIPRTAPEFTDLFFRSTQSMASWYKAGALIISDLQQK